MIQALDYITKNAQLYVGKFTDLFSYDIKKVKANFSKNRIVVDKRIKGEYISNNIPFVLKDGTLAKEKESLRLNFNSGVVETRGFFGVKSFEYDLIIKKVRISSYINDDIAYQKIEEESKSDPVHNHICLYWLNTTRNKEFNKENNSPYRNSISTNQEISLLQEIGFYAKIALSDLKGNKSKNIDQISYSHIDRLLIQAFSSILFERKYNSSFLLFDSINKKEIASKNYIVGMEFDYEERVNTVGDNINVTLSSFIIPEEPVSIKSDSIPKVKDKEIKSPKNKR